MSGLSMGFYRLKTLAIAIASAMTAAAQLNLLYAGNSVAQITPDATLPNNSNVDLVNKTLNINGGTQAGSNLFHSFKEFSVPTGWEAVFNNGADIQNILTRVTGKSISNIDGLIKANGSANLFLMNPNGIVFGENARLDIGGSFIGTSAESMKFPDGSEFSAVNSQSEPLLTVNLPLGLQYGKNPGSIQVKGDGQGNRTFDSPIINTQDALRVEGDKTITLVGGDINLEGATIKTAGGRIELGSVGENSLVGLVPDEKGFILDYGGVKNFADINLSQKTNIDASGEGAGDIQVQGRRVSFKSGAWIHTSSLRENQGGDLVVNATELLEIIGPGGGLQTSVYPKATGNGANVNIKTPNLLLQNRGQISSRTSGIGNAGDLNIKASNLVVQDRALITTRTSSSGQGGNLNIETGELLVRDGGMVDAGTSGAGNGGNIAINASESVKVTGRSASSNARSSLSTTSSEQSQGNAGNLNIKTDELLVQDGAIVNTSTLGSGNAGSLKTETNRLLVKDGGLITTSTLGTGNGGNFQIEASELLVRDGGIVDAGTSGAGNGGNFTINASESVKVIGTSADGRFSLLSTSSRQDNSGDAGDLTINTGQLLVQDGGEITAKTSGSGKGGNITVNASEDVKIIGRSNGGKSSTLATSSLFREDNSGDLGYLTIKTGNLLIKDGASITANTSGSGNGGSLDIEAGQLRLENKANIFSATLGTGNAGSLNIKTGGLLIKDGSSISTSTLGTGKGGNITVNASGNIKIIGRSADGKTGSTLSTSSAQGNSGNAGEVNIKTSNLLIQDGSSITTSTLGQGKGGNINVNASESIKIIGESADGKSSTLAISSLSKEENGGNTGDLTIKTGNLLLKDNASISATTYTGSGGSFNIEAGQLLLENRGSIFAGTLATGNAGSLNIKTGDLLVEGGSSITTSTLGAGQGGNINVNASENVKIIGRSADGKTGSTLFAVSAKKSNGNAGEINIKTSNFLIQDGASISTSTSGAGKGGNINVNASESIKIIGKSDDAKFSSGVFAQQNTKDATGNGGDLTITTGELLVQDGARVSTNTSGAGNAGNLNITANNKIQVIGRSPDGKSSSRLSARTNRNATGNGGDLTIKTGELLVKDGAEVSASTFGAGNGGSLNIAADNKIQVIGRSADGKASSGLFAQQNTKNATGDGGELNIKTGELLVQDGARVSTNTSGAGNAGNLNITANNKIQVIGRSPDGKSSSRLSARTNRNATGNGGDLTITTGELLVQDGAQVSVGTFGAGNGGSLNIAADNKIQVIGRSADGKASSGLFAQQNTKNATGNGGDLRITTGELLVQDGARVSASTSGEGNAGNLNITADNKIQVIGRSPDGKSSSRLSAQTNRNATGNGGDLTITTGELLVQDGAQVSASTFGIGNAGNLNITADQSIQIIGNEKYRGGLFAQGNKNSTGDARELNINTKVLRINRGNVFVRNLGSGNAGSLNIDADSIGLDKNATLSASTQSVNKDPNNPQANININSRDLILRGDSDIFANATGENVIGGNINIDSGAVAVLEKSRISANSDDFRGGRVIIDAQGIFGTQPWYPEALRGFITATGATPQLDGEVQENTQLDPSQGLIELPVNLVDATNQITNACGPGGSQFRNEFTITGRGGLPMSPTEPLQETNTLSSWVKLEPQLENFAHSASTTISQRPANSNSNKVKKRNKIVEATGWITDKNGNIEFVAQANQNNLQSSNLNSVSCSLRK